MATIRTTMKMRCFLLAVPLSLLLTVPAAAQDDPYERFTTDWRRNAIWDDGKAECAVYAATREIYGQSRQYTARLFTNTEHASPETFTKSANGTGRHVFKHHLREDIPTEKYSYHYSTMAYVGVDDLKSLKLDMGSQEDCGATFKQYVNHAGEMRWRQFSYFPNEGHKAGEAQPPANFAFQDALSLVLRGYPFDAPPEEPIELALLADQTSNKWSPTFLFPTRLSYVGRETLELPIGEVAVYHLRVVEPIKNTTREHDYWFAAEGDHVEDAPGLHIMVRYEGPNGQTYQLREVRRCAYWQD
ncbi:MAG: hypothetical protein ACODAQ_10255 [Phycisphaeraceae bacterium]